MAKLQIILIATILIASTLAASDCPLSSKVTSCSPKCVQDTECSTLGGRCCPNICNAKSCVLPNQGGSNSNQGGYKGTGGGAGSYCGNQKCNSFEKCEQDRSTKRPKCVRT